MAQKAKKKIGLRFFILIFVALMVYAVILLVRQQIKFHEISTEKQAVSTQLQQARDYNEYLQREIEQSYSDQFIEQQAREKLGWVKENEIKFIEK
ncbi:septum formation initiator family protein [Clostridia bacterium OttesenSCG-928-F22]|nr:septum formation initiator family protein [Clostridia bacterium OttesenSCG-928-F22]